MHAPEAVESTGKGHLDRITERKAERKPRAEALLMVAFFAIFTLIYKYSPVTQMFDSRYTLLLSEHLYQHGDLDLKAYFPEPGSTSPPYQITALPDGQVFYGFPIGTPVLSIPYMMAANAYGLRIINSQKHENVFLELKLQHFLASLLMAGFAVTVYITARLLLPIPFSVAIMLTVGLGTSVWSVASRGLWSHTWGIFLLGWVIYLLVRWAVKGKEPGIIWMGTLLSWIYIVRPTFWVSILFITLYVASVSKRKGAGVALTGLGWLGLFMIWSLSAWKSILPPYYFMNDHMVMAGYFGHLMGQLFSPSRGLLTFTPWLLTIVVLLIQFGRRIPHLRLVTLAGVCLILHTVLIAFWPIWWFGHSIGPRAFADMIPWMGLLAILTAAPLARSKIRFSPGLIAATLLAGASMVFHGAAAISPRAENWNALPNDIDVHPERLWDWRDPQFLAFLKHRG